MVPASGLEVSAAAPNRARPVGAKRDRQSTIVYTALSSAAFFSVAAVIGYRTATQLNVLGDPHTHHFGLADFRDGVFFPVFSFLSGNNPYDPSTHLSMYPVYYPFPLYSPSLLLVHLPFGFFSLHAASWLYFGLTLAGVLLIANLAFRLCGLSPTLARTFGVAAIILLSRPGHWNLFIGQFAVTMTLATYVALHFARNKPWLAAAGLAVCTIKPTFAVPLAVLMAARRDGRALCLGLVLAAALAAVPTAILVQRAGGLGSFLSILSRTHSAFASEAAVDPMRSPYRVDTPALVGRFLGSATGGSADAAVGLVILGFAALAVWRLSRGRQQNGRQLTAVVSCLAILAWAYHQAYDQVLLVVPLLALTYGQCVTAAFRVEWARWTVVALLGISALNYLASENAIGSLDIQGPAWTALASFNSVAVLASLVLCTWIALRLTGGATESQP